MESSRKTEFASKSPAHDGAGPWTRRVEIASVVGAYGLMAWHAVRFAQTPNLQHLSTLALVFLAWPTADFVSGVVHWSLDTWGSIDLPWVGPRLIKPFRVHHVNPQSFLECDFFNTNGDSASLCVAILVGVFLLPLDHVVASSLAVFLTALSFWGLPTNQIHQWAHMPAPPRWVAWLQSCRLILPRAHHGQHHREPFVRNYCITTGWCNPLLDGIGFWRSLESIVTWLTGIPARRDDADYFRAMTAPNAETGV